MSYTKTTWKSGDKITSALLNNIENGIADVESSVASLNTSVTNATNELTAAKALIQTNKETIEQNAADIAANVQRIQDQADAAAAHITAAEEAVANLNNGLDEIATIKTDLTTAAGVANDAKAKADANETEIGVINGKISTLEGINAVTKSQLSGLVAVDGVNVSKAEHKIETTSGGKKKTATIWNEASGGGVMFRNEALNRVTFLGVNEGEAIPAEGLGQSVDAQFYSKNPSTNTGTRVNFSIQGVFYTKNKSNGSYTADDEIMTKAMVNDLLASYVSRIQELESKVATLEANGATLSE